MKRVWGRSEKNNKKATAEEISNSCFFVVMQRLTVVELDDLFFIDVLGQFSTLRQADEFTFYSQLRCIQRMLEDANGFPKLP